MQQKLASVIQELTEGDEDVNGMNGRGYEDGPRSPDVSMGGGQGWQDPGFATPYGNGAATPYGATPYGQNGGNGWN